MNNKLFEALGFYWNRDDIPKNIPHLSTERVTFRFYKMLPEFVWDAIVLEGNPFTYPEVKTLLDGITVGGHKISDQEQVSNLAESSRWLLNEVKKGTFNLSKETFLKLNSMVARREALEWGVFRGEGQEHNYSPYVHLGEQGTYEPLSTEPHAPKLNEVFNKSLPELEKFPPLEKGLAFFLFGALQQFCFDGNKRTSRLMMNGILMSNGIDAISIPASRGQEFNEKMINFYISKDGTEMMQFLISCHPDFKNLHKEVQIVENTSKSKNKLKP